MLTATDTTAGTLSFLFYELSANPEIVAKLRREVLEIIGSDRSPSFEDIRNCTYLQKTISETLRLYPAVPYNVRLALRDTTLPRGAGPDGLQPVGVLKDTPIGACLSQFITLESICLRNHHPPLRYGVSMLGPHLSSWKDRNLVNLPGSICFFGPKSSTSYILCERRRT